MPHVNIASFSQTLSGEVADMFQGGLVELGYTVSVQMFTFDPAAINVVMPAVLFPTDALDRIPPRTIFYNTEDLEYQPSAAQQSVIEIVRRGFTVWDYARKNLAWFAANGCPDRVRHVPFGYSKPIDRVVRRPWEERTIDVLFYGKLTQRRVDVIAELMRTSLTVGVFSHAYGALRDDLMSRSKLVLNVPAVPAFIAECPRVTFCASNQKLCVSERPSYPLAPAWEKAIAFVPYREIVQSCQSLAADRDAVLAREAEAYAAMRTLPISAGLADAFAALSPGVATR